MQAEIQKKDDQNGWLDYQRAMVPMFRLERWQWIVLALTLIPAALSVAGGNLLLSWFLVCLGFISVNFVPAKSPARFVRFLAHKSPLKPVVHVLSVFPNGVIELDFIGSRRVVVGCQALSKSWGMDNTVLRLVATNYGGTIQAIATTGLPRSQWHDKAGNPNPHYLIMAAVDKDQEPLAAAERLLQAVEQAGIKPLRNADRSIFDVSAGHDCWAAHYFLELMPFDHPPHFVEEVMKSPIDYTLVMGLRAERHGDDTRYHAAMDVFIFAPSKLELTFYGRVLEATARKLWIKLRAVRRRKLPFSAAFQDEPLAHEIEFHMHPVHGPLLAVPTGK